MNILFSTAFMPLLTTLISGTVVIVGIVFIFSSIRKQDLAILRASNQDLRDAITDKTREIAELNGHIKGMETAMTLVQQRVYTLEKQNGDLQTLVKEALIVYFKSNPHTAQTLQDTVEAKT